MKNCIFSILGTILVSSISVLAEEPPAERWLACYNGLDNNSFDYSRALAIDNSGNVYVTGWSGPASPYSDYATIKYGPDGSQLWVARYRGPGNSYDSADAIAVDNSGNVYVTGISYGSGTGGDCVTIKYDPNGSQLWVNRYNGSGNGDDRAWALALDNSNNIYVTGNSVGSGTGYDCVTIKYDPNGSQLWVMRYNGPGNGFDIGRALAADDSGNVYVTGYSIGNGTNYDYATIKYDPNGSQLWVMRYNGPPNGVDQAYALALDDSGNVYVTGRSRGSGTSDDDYATVKYSSGGTQLWAARYNGLADNNDWATALAVDNSGNAYVAGVTGYSTGGSTKFDYVTVKYSPDGNQLWTARYIASLNLYADPIIRAVLAIDDSDNVYLAGNRYDSGTGYNWATIKYDPNGSQLWVMSYNGPANSSDEVYGLAVDNSGNVYVTGWSIGSGTHADYATIKYTQHDYCMNPFPADYDGDCKVNFTDFAMLAEDWRQSTYFADLAELVEDWLECNFALTEDCL
jgi:uncharacterized delta-60 repeat protein